jgi:hypothetical protein
MGVNVRTESTTPLTVLLLHLIAAFAFFHAPQAHASAAPGTLIKPPSYAQIDWNNRHDPYFVTLGHDDFLVDGGSAFQIWNGNTRTLSTPHGWPRHTMLQREWARMARGTLVVGQSHGFDDRPYHAVLWWNPGSRSFSAPLTVPGEPDVDHVINLVTIDDKHALVCVGRTEPYDAAKNGIYATLPNRAFLIELQNGQPQRAQATPQARALLRSAGVQGQVDGVEPLDQATASAALVYDTAECRWKPRVVPAVFKGATYVTIDPRRLPDGRIILLSAYWSNTDINGGRLKQPLLWDATRAAWTALAAAPHDDLWPHRYWNFGMHERPVLAGSGGLSFLNPRTLQWDNVSMQLPKGGVTAVAPLSNGAVLATLFRQGEIVLGSTDTRLRPRSITLQPSASATPAALAAAPVDAAARVPLQKAEFDAVVKESNHRYRNETSPAAAWESLDRARLARMLNMPEFAALPEKSALLNQAAAWELMYFEKPSDAQAMWRRWLPGNGIGEPVGAGYARAEAPRIQDANERWGREAAAMAALLQCLPAAAWREKWSPTAAWHAAVFRLSDWQPRFGPCVRGQDDEGGNPGRGAMSAAVLERKLSAYLLANGCRGEGPDDCLLLLNALVSLSPRHPDLPRIIALLAPSFALADSATSRDRVWLRLVFLSEQISTLIAQPAPLPITRIEAVLREAFELERVFDNLEVDNDNQHLQRLPELYSPWARLAPAGKLPAPLARLVNDMGRASARVPGCAISAHQGRRRDYLLPFWLAFAVEKLEREQRSCGVLGELSGAAYLYSGPAQYRSTINGLRKFLATPGAARDDVMQGLSSFCQGEADPWHICRDLGKAK